MCDGRSGLWATRPVRLLPPRDHKGGCGDGRHPLQREDGFIARPAGHFDQVGIVRSHAKDFFILRDSVIDGPALAIKAQLGRGTALFPRRIIRGRISSVEQIKSSLAVSEGAARQKEGCGALRRRSFVKL